MASAKQLHKPVCTSLLLIMLVCQSLEVSAGSSQHQRQIPSYEAPLSNILVRDYHHEEEPADCESQDQDDDKHQIDAWQLDYVHQPPSKVMTITIVDNHSDSNKHHQHQIVQPNFGGHNQNCYASYDLANHGAIFSKVNTQATRSKPETKSVQTVFVQPKSIVIPTVEERKRNLIEKFPVKVPKLTQVKTSHISNPFVQEQFKLDKPAKIGYDTADWSSFATKSHGQNNEMDQQTLVQAKVDHFDAGPEMVTQQKHTDVDTNEDFDTGSITITNKVLGTKGSDDHSSSRTNDLKLQAKTS